MGFGYRFINLYYYNAHKKSWKCLLSIIQTQIFSGLVQIASIVVALLLAINYILLINCIVDNRLIAPVLNSCFWRESIKK